MFPAGPVLRTVAVITALLAAFGAWTMFWLLVAMATGQGDWSVGRTAIACACWLSWIAGWALLTRRLWRSA